MFYLNVNDYIKVNKKLKNSLIIARNNKEKINIILNSDLFIKALNLTNRVKPVISSSENIYFLFDDKSDAMLFKLLNF